jgi:hypothetical protein
VHGIPNILPAACAPIVNDFRAGKHPQLVDISLSGFSTGLNNPQRFVARYLAAT